MASATPLRREQPPWSAPESSAPLPPLSIYNTLTRKKDAFMPIDKSGKKVTWYCCGPTVYDAAHLGHARNYVTTDVLRRIMRDYFGFDVTFVQNVTDVDDKIILRARQKHLLDEFAGLNPSVTAEVLETAGKAWHAYFDKNAALDPEDLGTTPEQFDAWSESKHGILMELIAKEASKSGFYAATTSVLLPYLDSLHKNRDFEPAVFAKLSSYWERHFNEDMATLNVLPPTVVTRVSEFIPENVEFVRKLVEKGFAYPTADGSSLIADGEGALASSKASTLPNTVNTSLPETKKSKHDFALWKASKAGEPSWESPWGKGRPGWHIECSVMCSAVLGEQIDIHSGGVDLAFPHHDNEIAQSEAYWDCADGKCATADGKHQWINYFLHMGHLQIHGSKMSKSLKNFVSVRDALQRGGWTARGLRIVFLLGGWKEGIEVREGVLAEAKSWETVVNKFFTNVKALMTEEELAEVAGKPAPQPYGALEHSLAKSLDDARRKLDLALCDSFNTAEAMGVLLELISATNIYMKSTASLAIVKEVARWITRVTTIFGLDSTPTSTVGWTTEATAAANAEEAAMPYIRLLSSFRDSIRTIAIADPASASSREILSLCDRLRDIELADLGVSLDDRDASRPALVKFVPAEELRAAREEKERKLAEKDAKKEEARRKREEEDRKKDEAAKVDPTTMFRTPEWSEWDADGMPTKDAKGEEVTKSRSKALKKLWDRQKKAHDAWKAKQ
ncbi:tRNA synthetases class I (C) catalytic domain-containing protein [Tricharina praecox]|uniref:tRNA synthetases class I (C) catalytic domain-containing protein n=1 Tax=Tricharina praecox TaxID=43433 RepID=UPI00221FD1FC|nr:tRNA synthetases class I (C) catalytic domain-containing protein [Tricharina praecox]KAI5844738.1 tRNA synthetases class I (C) catalytic domain-containing protein [Tricharina praecox]